MVRLYENYKDYQPPRFVHRTVANLLSWLPKQYLSGLQSVVLTNAKAIGRGKTIRVRGKRHFRHDCRGFYHPGRHGEAPWIEIVVDNIIAGLPHVFWYLPVVRNLAFTETLFHEVGHHLDFTIGAPARSGEAAAEAWKERLSRSYAREHYWYLVVFARFVVKPVVRLRHIVVRSRTVSRQN
jgi:hypothetical protein